MKLPSALLIARAQLGDPAALNDLLRAIERPLFDYIVPIVGDRDEALDVLQAVLLTIARKLSSLRDVSLFRAWCFRIATRDAIRHHKGNDKWRSAVRGEELLALESPESDSRLDADTLRSLSARISELPPASQLVIRMHYYEELSYEEISEALDIAVGTVKSRLAYGRGVLRRMLAGE